MKWKLLLRCLDDGTYQFVIVQNPAGYFGAPDDESADWQPVPDNDVNALITNILP